MRPVYLEFCGINSFSEKAEIDFTKLLDGGLFGIFGDTGSGKSTILDCIHFALYGKIERSSGTDSINYKCDKAYVIYAFEILEQGKRRAYRVRRERRRKNNVAKAFLDEYDEDGNLRGLAEGVGEVDRRIEEIVGLSFDDFKKCIALPQGEFAGLVKAKPSERLQLVSRLFDLEKYGDKLSATIRSRSEKTSNEAGLLLAKMQENAGGSEETIRAETEKLRLAREELKAADKALDFVGIHLIIGQAYTHGFQSPLRTEYIGVAHSLRPMKTVEILGNHLQRRASGFDLIHHQPLFICIQSVRPAFHLDAEISPDTFQGQRHLRLIPVSGGLLQLAMDAAALSAPTQGSEAGFVTISVD